MQVLSRRYAVCPFMLLWLSLVASCAPVAVPSPTRSVIPTPTSMPSPTPSPSPTAMDPDSQAYIQQGDSALFKGDVAAAEDAYKRSLEATPYAGLTYSHLAFLYALQPAHWRESLDLAQRAVDLAPDNAETWAYLSLIDVANGHYDQILDSAKNAVRLEYEDPLAHVALGQAYMIYEDNKAAQRELDIALALDPQNILAHIVQSRCYSKQQKLDLALLAAEKALDLAPNFAYAHLSLAQAHLDALEYPEAHAALDAALAIAPDYLPALLLKARLYATQGAMEIAIDRAARAENLATTPSVLYTSGWLHLQQGEVQIAHKKFQQARSLDPAYVPGYLGQGQTHYEMRACGEAMVAFRQALDLFPKSGAGHLGLARSLACLGENAGAEESYGKALLFGQHTPDILVGVAEHMTQIEAHERALDLYHAALIQAPEQAQIYIAIGYEHLLTSQTAQAAQRNFQQALALEPDNLSAMTGLGLAYNAQHAYDQAITIFRRALEIDPHLPKAHYGLGVAYTMRGQYRDAITCLEKALEQDEQIAEAYLYLGRAYREMKEYPAAGQAFFNYLWRNPNMPTAHVVRHMAQSLSEGTYWIAEAQALPSLKAMVGTHMPMAKDAISVTLISASIERLNRQRTFKVVVETENSLTKPEALYQKIVTIAMYGAALTPRILPAAEGGLWVVVRTPEQQKLVEAYISAPTAQDLMDGLLQDHAHFMRHIVWAGTGLVGIQQATAQDAPISRQSSPLPSNAQTTEVSESATETDVLLALLGFPENSPIAVQSTPSLQHAPIGGRYPRQDTIAPPRPDNVVYSLAISGEASQDTPVPPMPADLYQLDNGWQSLDTRPISALNPQAYLASHTSPDLASIATTGHVSNRYIPFRNKEDGRPLLVWKTVWESMGDAREFMVAHQVAFGRHQAYQEALRDLRGGQRTLRWQSDKRAIHLIQERNTVWLVFATHPRDLDVVAPLLRE